MIGQILLQLILIALNAIFACAEIAVISSNETRIDKLAEQGNKPAKRLQALQNRPAQFSCNHSGCHYAFRLFGQCLCR